MVWVQLGLTRSGAATTSIRITTSILEVGSDRTGGRSRSDVDIRSGQVFDGIDGILAADFNADDFRTNDSDTDTAVDSTGKAWTIHGASSIVLGGGPISIQPKKIASIGEPTYTFAC